MCLVVCASILEVGGQGQGTQRKSPPLAWHQKQVLLDEKQQTCAASDGCEQIIVSCSSSPDMLKAELLDVDELMHRLPIWFGGCEWCDEVQVRACQ